MPNTVHCVSLLRHWHGHARLDLWHAESKESWWVELHLGPRRILQSPGYADRELAEAEFERQKEGLPKWYEDVVEELDKKESE